MTTTVIHRRAERFAQLLEEAAGARRRHVRSPADDGLTPLVAVGQRVGRIHPNVEMDPDFRAELRASLVARAEREGIGVTDTAPEVGSRAAVLARLARLARPLTAARRPATTATTATTAAARRARARAAVIVGVAAGTLALSGMSAASGDAMPGDALYGIKRSTERAQLALAGSDVSRGQLYLEFAKTRVAEARAVRHDAAGLDGVLDDMDTETRQGVRLLTTAAVDRRDRAAIDAVDSFVDLQKPNVTALIDLPLPDVRERVLESLKLLDSINGRTADLRRSLTCNGSRSVDTLGPLPGTCGTALPRTGAARGGTAKGGVGGPQQGGPGAAPDSQEEAGSSDGGLLRELGRLLAGLFGN